MHESTHEKDQNGIFNNLPLTILELNEYRYTKCIRTERKSI